MVFNEKQKEYLKSYVGSEGWYHLLASSAHECWICDELFGYTYEDIVNADETIQEHVKQLLS